MGLRYTTCLEPNDLGSEVNEKLMYKTSKLSAQQSYYEYHYTDEEEEDEEEFTDVAEEFNGGQEISENDEESANNDDSLEQVSGEVVEPLTSELLNTSTTSILSSIRSSGRPSTARRRGEPARVRIARPNPFFRRHHKYNINGRAITYACSDCLTHLSSSNLIISDRYHGATGDALLIYDVVNVQMGPPQLRRMTTGVYTVCELLCRQCGKYLGWKYLKSSDSTQKFKEGRFILEVDLLTELNS
ncbi:DEKNAAC101757 [Brettanomyces naardenensis]|uniref:DEKNAAC101757 n=1 Tax=Brettanomyces naardenensis TaxID=13370 RepID=A0A448YIQ9_BRENA|nr:DEKNAAC101757 [Brettanomyces naardenensis]